jgi:ABC-2 type transport system ATP-binding protein/lipopolysaccharide transport system ATP-binding protein
MSRNAIEVQDVGKRYWLGKKLAAHVTLQETIASKLRLGRVAPAPRQEVWALRDVSFEAREGEALGLIGHNGAGKTTLLKILCRITRPTSGVSRTRGHVGALLDVGSGFHMELTGRENVFLNGAILGMKRREIRRRYEEIVDFAGLEGYMDTPIKRYSWGMHLRLAFAVAAHVEPEIVLVDEVLAVGDLRFREKCLGKMTEFGREGRTVVFVSHDLGSINQVCSRAIWLDHGQIRADGSSRDVIDQYVRSAAPRTAREDFVGKAEGRVQLRSAAVVDEHGQVEDAPRRDEPLTVSVRFLVRERIPGLDIAFSLQNQQGVQVLNEVWGLDTGSGLNPDRVPAEYEASLTIPPILAAGDYLVGVWIGTRYDVLLDEQVLGFRLWPHPADQSKVVARDRVVQPEVRWDVRPAGPTAVEDVRSALGDG